MFGSSSLSELVAQELVEVQWWPVLRELVQVRKSIRESFSLLSKEELGWAVFEDYSEADVYLLLPTECVAAVILNRYCLK